MCPCNNCPHRKLVCHDHCEEYLTYHEEKVNAKRANRGKHEADDYVIKMVIKRRKGAHLR